MYYTIPNFSSCHGVWPLYRDCPLLGRSVKRGSTVYHARAHVYAMHVLYTCMLVVLLTVFILISKSSNDVMVTLSEKRKKELEDKGRERKGRKKKKGQREGGREEDSQRSVGMGKLLSKVPGSVAQIAFQNTAAIQQGIGEK